MPIPNSDRTILRDVAKQVAEIARLPIQKERAELWRRHNDLQRVRPMVLIFPEGAWGEMPIETHAQDPEASSLELDLRRRLYYWEYLRDDNVIEPLVVAPAAIHDSGWGLEAQLVRPEQITGAAHHEAVIRAEADIEKIKTPRISVDLEATERRYREYQEIFAGILAVEKRAYAYNVIALIDEFATWRGLEQTFLDLMDRPRWVHEAMERLLEGAIARHEAIMRTGLVTLNNRNHHTGSGGTGYTSQLPQKDFDGSHVRSQDLWGFGTTQIFSEVSPAMHEEFALHYERRFLSRFGLNAYGCCEPLHHKLELVKTIPNLRRISISPWADVRRSAEQLGNRFIFSYKPNPAALAADTWRPEAVRQDLRRVLELARGCVIEIVMKDTHTCRHQPQRMWEWVRIAREVAEEYA